MSNGDQRGGYEAEQRRHEEERRAETDRLNRAAEESRRNDEARRQSDDDDRQRRNREQDGQSRRIITDIDTSRRNNDEYFESAIKKRDSESKIESRRTWNSISEPSSNQQSPVSGTTDTVWIVLSIVGLIGFAIFAFGIILVIRSFLTSPAT